MPKKLQTSTEMAQEISKRPNARLNYKEQSDAHKAETLANNLDFQLTALKEVTKRKRVDLHNLEQVQTRTFEYITACKSAAAFPSVMGLSVYGFGLSRQRLNQFLRDHQGEPSAEFVEQVKDVFADTLVNQSLYRNADATQVIFQLKNCNGFSDKLEIEPVQSKDGPLGPLLDPEELRKRIESCVVTDDDFADE